MRNAHQVADVRAAESALMAQLPDGTLMQRAATGLASACARLLGQVYGSRVVILAGTGDNGGDALYAGALPARRRAALTAISTGTRAHARAGAALLASGGRLSDLKDGAGPKDGPGPKDGAGLIDGADIIIDGILGIGGGGGPRGPPPPPGR